MARCFWRWGETRRSSRTEAERLLAAAIRSESLGIESLHPNLRDRLGFLV